MVDGIVAALHKEYMDRKALMNDTIDQLLPNVVKMVDLLKEDIVFLAAGLKDAEKDWFQTREVSKCTRSLKDDKYKYLCNLYAKKRQPAATHVLVFLVSEERRNRKPYALPVQYIPYKSIKDQHVRDYVNKIKEAMVSAGMKPVGKYHFLRNLICIALAITASCILYSSSNIF